MLPDGTIDLNADPSTVALVEFEKQNSKAVNLLIKGGFNGEVFRKYAPRKEAPKEIVAKY